MRSPWISPSAEGFRQGRIVEIYGPESSGKTTLTLHIVANAQRTGGICAFVDAEHALDPVYAKKLGVDFDNLLVSQPDTGEQALEIVEMLVRSSAVDVVVIDSVAALVPRVELEGEMGDSHRRAAGSADVAGSPKAHRRIVAKSNTCTVVFTNQIREKIGVMFGSPETTTGGRALKFYASVRLDIRRIGRITDRDEVTGNRTKVTVKKNKIAPPFRVVEFDIMFSEGISLVGDVLDMAVEHGFVSKSGSWYCQGDIRLGQGRERAKQFLRDDPAMLKDLKEKLLDKLDPRRQKPAEPAKSAVEEAAPAAGPARGKGRAKAVAER